MAFSSTSGLLGSCLFGGLWEPGIPCNMVSQWLGPAFKELGPALFETKQPLPVIWAFSERRPNLAPLWLGATITGLLPQIIRVSMSFMPTTILEGVAWAQSPQSFMDPSNHRRALIYRDADKTMISREDELRLLFLTDTLSETHGPPPICPYSPFGRVDIHDTSLEVRLHHACDHRLVYCSWEWQCQKGEKLSDFGPQTELQPPQKTFGRISLPALWILIGVACGTMFNETVSIPILTGTVIRILRRVFDDIINLGSHENH